MSEDFLSHDELIEDDGLDLELDAAASDDAQDNTEYEEISCEEVDRVIAVLEELIESVESENIQFHLEEAADRVFNLVYEVEDEEDDTIQGEAA